VLFGLSASQAFASEDIVYSEYEVSGQTILAPIKVESLKYLTEKPKFVWREFIIGGRVVLSEVLTEALLWKPEIPKIDIILKAEAEEVSLKEAIQRYIDVIVNKFILNGDKINKIVECESQYNPFAINPKDVDGYPKYGLLQWYLPTYYGAGGTDWTDWMENLDIAAPMWVKDGYGRWPVCSGEKTFEEVRDNF